MKKILSLVCILYLTLGMAGATPLAMRTAYTTNFPSAAGCHLGHDDCLDWEEVQGVNGWVAGGNPGGFGPGNAFANDGGQIDIVRLTTAAKTFSADQSMEMNLKSAITTGFRYIGPGVRLSVSGATGYYYRCDNGSFIKTSAGTETPFGSTHTFCTNSDVVKLSVTGSVFTLSFNGVQDGSTESDGTYTSGQPGMWGYPTGGAAVELITADDVGGGGGPVLPKNINNPFRGCCKVW